MKIMFLIRSLNVGGAEHQMVLLACGLHQRGHDVSVAVLYPGGPFQNVLLDAGVKVHELSKRNRWDLIDFFRNLSKLVKNEEPDILHGYQVIPNLLTICLKMMACKSKMVWGVRASNVKFGYYDWTASVTFKVSCAVSKYADLIIANSTTGMKYHRSKGYPEDKLRVIYNGIDTEKFNANSAARKKIRAEWGVHDNEKVIGIVGRLDPMKNYELFIQAANIMAKKRQDVRFVCVGDGSTDYKAKLYDLSEHLVDTGRLLWIGSRHDMPYVYNGFDIITNCSHTEGFPNVVGEAMSSNVACVVTDVGDSSSIVGKLGIVIQDISPGSLLEGWSKSFELKRLVNSDDIRSRIINNYSTNKLIEKTELLLLNVIG